MGSEGGGSGAMNHVRSFLKGRHFPGTVRLSRRDKPGQQAFDSGSSSPTIASVHMRNESRDSAAGSLDDEGTAGTTGLQGAERCADGIGRMDLNDVGSCSPSSARSPMTPAVGSPFRSSTSDLRSMSDTRVKKFHKLLGEQVVDLDALRELAWSGIPADLRPVCWQLLLGYLPPNRERREQILQRKRREYRDMVPEFYDIANSERSEDELGALRQVAVDVPRTAPGVAFFSRPAVQKSLERILYIWGIRHPASGYVQGINDLVTPFLAVFLSPHFESEGMEEWGVDELAQEVMTAVEADSYWCLCKLLDGIQDHYTYAQPGIQRSIFHLKELVRRIDEPVAQHLDNEGLEFLQFAFRWVNCLLIRELPFGLATRLWDTYLAEGSRMRDFLIYVFAAFLLSWSAELKAMEFQEMILFLQKLPTANWSEKDVEVVLSRAYMWRASFDDARSHLTQS
ncbi:hypothetical protein WJX72_004752 [[Myrmecia] bisecta]|uniref:Rab-GAP TBC domain-containing protein n=1 Tax=[Myrmecia] bisecta TaxID=41462 RepID=A0AAW1P3G7_9CHLO